MLLHTYIHVVLRDYLGKITNQSPTAVPKHASLCPSVDSVWLLLHSHVTWAVEVGVIVAQQGSLSGWGMKLEEHDEIDVTVRGAQTLPDAQAQRGRGPLQSHPPGGHDSPGRRAKRCQMWRKRPGLPHAKLV